MGIVCALVGDIFVEKDGGLVTKTCGMWKWEGKGIVSTIGLPAKGAPFKRVVKSQALNCTIYRLHPSQFGAT